MRLVALMCMASLLTLTVLACAGCGKTEQGAAENQEETEGEDEAGNTTIITIEDGDTTGEVGEDEGEDASISGGTTDFILEGQEIGSGEFIEDLKVTDIRWADHEDYFRIVFEFEYADGSEVTEVPNCQTWYPGAPGDERFYELFISLEDVMQYRFDYAPFVTAEVPHNLGNPLVEAMERAPGADTEPVFFLVTCAHSEAHPGVSSRPHRLMYESDPMRVILDIRKM